MSNVIVFRSLLIMYVFIIHIFIAVILVKSNFINMIGVRFGFYTPDITPYYSQMISYHKSIDNFVPSGAVIFIGDSITQGLATLAVVNPSVNYGIGSDTTVGVLRRVDDYHSVRRAKAVVLAIGLNDLPKRSNEEIILNYQNILNKIPFEIRIIVNAVLPVDGDFARSDFENSRISDLNSSIYELTLKYPNVTFVNFFNDFKDSSGELKNDLHVGDGVHLSEKGYALWISSLSTALKYL